MQITSRWPTCACRVSVAKCDKPKEVCLIFGETGEFLVERGFARQISKEEGMKVLDLAEEAGLVHTSNNSADRATSDLQLLSLLLHCSAGKNTAKTSSRL